MASIKDRILSLHHDTEEKPKPKPKAKRISPRRMQKTASMEVEPNKLKELIKAAKDHGDKEMLYGLEYVAKNLEVFGTVEPPLGTVSGPRLQALLMNASSISCPRCGKNKPAADFGLKPVGSNGEFGLQSYCETCRTESSVQSRKNKR